MIIISLSIIYFFSINKYYKSIIIIFLSKDSQVKILYKYHPSFLSFLLYQIEEKIISIHYFIFHQIYEKINKRSIHPLPHPSFFQSILCTVTTPIRDHEPKITTTITYL